MTPRTATPAPTDRSMWRKLLRARETSHSGAIRGMTQALQRHGRNHPPACEMLTNGNFQQLPRAREGQAGEEGTR